MASVWFKRGARVLIVLLSATALLVWHPEWVTSHPSAPALVEVERHAVAKGVTLRTGRVQGTSWRVIDLAVDLASARLQVGEAGRWNARGPPAAGLAGRREWRLLRA